MAKAKTPSFVSEYALRVDPRQARTAQRHECMILIVVGRLERFQTAYDQPRIIQPIRLWAHMLASASYKHRD
jgi:hypothetical protein